MTQQDKSQIFIDLLSSLNASLDYYVVEPSTRVCGEDGKYIEGGDETVGYAIVNSITGVTEHTSLILPGIIFQAQHFDSTLKSLLQVPDKKALMPDTPGDDVVLM